VARSTKVKVGHLPGGPPSLGFGASDPAGASDLLAWVVDSSRPTAEGVGLGDAVTVVVAAAKGQFESVGLTDSVSAVLNNSTAVYPSDTLYPSNTLYPGG
jgi:hypothetical protein